MSAASHYPILQSDGVVTHVMVPIDEFRQMVGAPPEGAQAPSAAEIDAAMKVLEDPGTKWHDADSLLWQIVREGLGSIRKERGMTQEELAGLLGISQPRVSRMERSLEGATLKVLRRIATILAEGPGEKRRASSRK